jgi:Fuc2NAc and GlcNAc transferase
MMSAPASWLIVALPVGALIASIIGITWYREIALRRGILAQVSSRTLHDRMVPRGGGIVLAVVSSAALLVGWIAGAISIPLLLSVGAGGAAAGAIGFADDVHDLPPARKFALHVSLSLWLFAVLYTPFLAPWLRAENTAAVIAFALVFLFIPVWLINLFNFIDGIDGLAASAAMGIAFGMIAILALTGGDERLILVLGVLAASVVGFLWFNRPPASIFMGDAGSIFLGYCLSALLLTTVASRQLSIWTWIAALGYFIADTTTTTLSRMLMVKRWYGVHRSHAYQNLARIHKSHALVTYGITAYQFFWALPLAVWSGLRPAAGPMAAFLSVAPIVAWTLRFGPRLSSD